MAYGSSQTSLTYVGMVGIIDPPREGVRESIDMLHRSNVQVKMVTGDAEQTAVAIGKCSKILPVQIMNWLTHPSKEYMYACDFLG